MDTHRANYKRWKSGTLKEKVTSYNLFEKYGVENCVIVLLESMNVETKDELHARAAYYITTLLNINHNISNRTKYEYYLDNKEAIDIKNKQYY